MMRPLDLGRALALSLVLALAPSTASATTVRPVTMAELTRAADDVVVVTVRRSSSHWEGRVIVTDHEVQVTAALKGASRPGALMVVRTPGGVVGRVGQTIPDASTLDVGRSYVLFLSGGDGAVRYLAHLTAAAAPVSLDASGNGVEVTTPTALTPPATMGVSGAPVALERFARAVREVSP